MYILKETIGKNHGRLKSTLHIYHTIPPSNVVNSKESPREILSHFPWGSYGKDPILPWKPRGGRSNTTEMAEDSEEVGKFFRVERFAAAKKWFFRKRNPPITVHGNGRFTYMDGWIFDGKCK